MKRIHFHIPSSIGFSTIIVFAILAVIFIYLSKSTFDSEMSILDNKVLYIPHNKYTEWFLKDDKKPYADVLFQYDQSQKDKMIINNYEIAPVTTSKNITSKEVKKILLCYRDGVCDVDKTTQLVKDIINRYPNSIAKDDLVIIYGVAPNNESDWHVDSHMFIVGDNVFVEVVNPIESRLNNKYKQRIASGEDVLEVEEELWNEILSAQTPEITSDLNFLKKIANSVQIVPREE